MTADLIEDLDGAPLPDTLQTGSPIWQAVHSVLGDHVVFTDGEKGAELTDEVMRALTPVLWPLLPDNDDSQLSRLIGVAHALLAVASEVLPDPAALRYALLRLDTITRECGATSTEGDTCQLPRGHHGELHQDGLGDAWNKQWGPRDAHPDWTSGYETGAVGPEPF